jgi:signal transduction histidine kinase
MRWITAAWRAQSLRARITIVATTLFAVALLVGTFTLFILMRIALTRALDSSAVRAGRSIAAVLQNGNGAPNVLSGAGDQIQIVDADDQVLSASPGADGAVSLLRPDELARARTGSKITIPGRRGNTGDPLRVVAVTAADDTVLVASDTGSINDSIDVLRTIALFGSPVAFLIMGIATYSIVGRTLRPVAGLRRGAEQITEAGLTDQRLPVPDASDEIHRLAVTLNVMLDRIAASTRQQRSFIGDAAHELRSPLASLRVQLDVAQRLGPATDWTAVIDDALIDVSRLEQLVNDLLALARSDEAGNKLSRREPVEVNEVIDEVTTQYANARVPVTASTPAGASTIEGDPQALRRVAVNLLDNGVRYAASSVEIAVTSANGHVTMTVDDDGPGIPLAERDRVFDRFYRLESSRARDSGGTGLGLAIVRDIVHAHGGTIVLTDPPSGSGLRALITLPSAPVPS